MREPLECPRCHRRHSVRAGSALTICPTCDSPPGLAYGPSEKQVRRYLYQHRLPLMPRVAARPKAIEAHRV